MTTCSQIIKFPLIFFHKDSHELFKNQVHPDQDIQLGQCPGSNLFWWSIAYIPPPPSKNAVQVRSDSFKSYSFFYLQVILVGNKCDMEDERVSWKNNHNNYNNYDNNDDTKPHKITSSIDLSTKKWIQVISYERGKQLADSLGLDFFETSAKENINVRVRCLLDHHHWSSSALPFSQFRFLSSKL